MSPTIRRMLWGAFFGLALLTVAGVAATIAILQMEQRREYRIQESTPLLDTMRRMDEAIATLVSASRGFELTDDAAFMQQYDDAERTFATSMARARELA